MGRSRQDCSTSRRKVWRGALADTMAGRSQQPGLPHRPCQSIQGCCEVWPSIGQLHEIECDGEKKRPGNRSPTPLTVVGRASYFGGFHGGFKTFETFETFDASSKILLARTWGAATVRSRERGRFSDPVAGSGRMSHGLTTHTMLAASMRPPCSSRRGR